MSFRANKACEHPCLPVYENLMNLHSKRKRRFGTADTMWRTTGRRDGDYCNPKKKVLIGLRWRLETVIYWRTCPEEVLRFPADNGSHRMPSATW